jgi:hypothetical protein
MLIPPVVLDVWSDDIVRVSFSVRGFFPKDRLITDLEF